MSIKMMLVIAALVALLIVVDPAGKAIAAPDLSRGISGEVDFDGFTYDQGRGRKSYRG